MREYIIKIESDKPLPELIGENLRALIKITGDFDEIIRCKDCKKFVTEEDQTYCIDMFGQCGENGFCAWSEQRKEE